MDQQTLVALVVLIAVVVIAALIVVVYRRRRRERGLATIQAKAKFQDPGAFSGSNPEDWEQSMLIDTLSAAPQRTPRAG